MIDNPILVTPFILDRAIPELEALAGSRQPAWPVNRPALPEGPVQARMAAWLEPLAGFVTGALAQGRRPVSLSGDCCSAIGFLAGLQRAGIDPVVIWLDAHGDFNTWQTSPSGFIGGMPLAMLTGRGEQTLLNAVHARPLDDRRVILSEGRDLDPGEKELLASSKIHHLPDIRAVPDHPRCKEGPIYIHYDTDVVDLDHRGGASLENTRGVFRALAATRRVVGVSVSTLKTKLDLEERAQSAWMSLLAELVARGPA